jgi:fatty-acyl-CoA synthase
MQIPLSPLQFLERAERLFGRLDGVVGGSRRLTYSQFGARAHRLAWALRRDLGCQRGDRVAYLCGNTCELLEAYYGVLLAGAVLTPLNVRLSTRELQAIIEDSRPSVLMVHPSFAEVAESLVGVRRVGIGDEYEGLLASQSDRPFPVEPFDENEVCELFFTSGTVGQPRGVMLTHRALATHAVDSALTLGINHRDVILHTIPLFHVNGWGAVHYVTALGARHVLMERYDARTVLQLIEAERVTRLFLVPAMANALLAEPKLGDVDVSSLVQVSVGGAVMPRTTLVRLEEALGCEVISGYGLTEASPQVTKSLTTRGLGHLSREESRSYRVTAGIPMIGVDVRLLDEFGREIEADGSTVGEICIRSNHVMAGYWNQPDATSHALRGGWLHTGDLATMNGEGHLSIVYRAKDIIISGGENVSSIEIENTLVEHPSVAEAAVVAMLDDQWGEIPRAFIVLRVGASVDATDLVAWARQRLARFKVPRRIDFVESLPRTATGKVQKRLLQEAG